METTTIESRTDFTLWAIERAQAIVADQAGDLAVAARDGNDEEIARTANALGKAISEALIEVFDGLLPEE